MATGWYFSKKRYYNKSISSVKLRLWNWLETRIKTWRNTFKKHYYFCNNVIQKGEYQIWTRNSIYGLSPQIRKQLDTNSKASIFIDFKPSLTLENIHSKIKLSKYRSTTDILKKELKLSTSQIDLLKLYLSKESYLNTESIAQNIKSFIYTFCIHWRGNFYSWRNWFKGSFWKFWIGNNAESILHWRNVRLGCSNWRLSICLLQVLVCF
jgi:hypothetical protein